MIGKENNMKKILSLVLALGMIFSLAACSGGSESGGSTAADDGQIYEFKLSIMNADQPFKIGRAHV